MAWEIIALGLGPGNPTPAIIFTGSLPKEGSNFSHLLGNYSREASLPRTPKTPQFLPCVCVPHTCAHACVLVKTGCG